MTGNVVYGWRLAAVAAVLLVAAAPSWADDGSPVLRARVGETPGAELVSEPEVSREDGAYRLVDAHLDYPAA